MFLKSLCLNGIVFSVALTCCGVSFAQVYKWVDESGKVHFGDQPPASANAETIDLPEQRSNPAPVVSDQERMDRQRRLVQALEEERLQKEQAKQQEKKKKAERLVACKQLMGRIKHSESISRYYRYDEEGEKSYISNEQADEYRQKLKDTYKKNCQN